MRSCPGLGDWMVDDGIMLTGLGRIPTEPEPLLSVDAMEGCRIRSIIDVEVPLCHGIVGTPNVTVCPLELLCELGGPRASGESIIGRDGLESSRSSSLGTGESGGELKGAMASGTLVARCESELRSRLFCAGKLAVLLDDNGALTGPPFCGDARG